MNNVAVIAPHPDDETLGLGGTMAKLASQGHEVNVLVVSGHLPPLYKREDYERTANEANRAFKILGVSNSKFLEIPATMIGDVPINELNNNWLKSRESFLSLIDDLDHIIIEKGIFNHSIIGRINLKMTLDFFDFHFNHHVKKINKISILI